MVLAFGALEPLALAAAALSRGVLVAAAGVVVVLAILLVFVMVLRGGGSSRQKVSGLDYDAQQGPFGQPHAPANEPGRASGAPWSGSQMGQMGQMGQSNPTGMSQMDDRFDSMGAGRPAPMPQQQQQSQGWGAPFAEPTPDPANAWGGPEPMGDRWGEQMAPAGGAMGGAMGGANDWGTPPAQGYAQNPQNPWDAPAANVANGANPAWNNQSAGSVAPSTRPGQNAGPLNPWDSPAAPAAWNAPAAPSQPQWGGQPDQGMMPATTPRGANGYSAPRLFERKSDGSGREFDLRKERLTIGRHRESDVFLEDLAVSRLHTTISNDGRGHYILRDENSANGTYVNGQRVSSDYVLQDGDEVQVGQTVLVFQQR